MKEERLQQQPNTNPDINLNLGHGLTPDDINPTPSGGYERNLITLLMTAALNGSAMTVATRHDCTPGKMAKVALKIAEAAAAELDGVEHSDHG